MECSDSVALRLKLLETGYERVRAPSKDMALKSVFRPELGVDVFCGRVCDDSKSLYLGIGLRPGLLGNIGLVCSW